jgi:hypothetical protein
MDGVQGEIAFGEQQMVAAHGVVVLDSLGPMLGGAYASLAPQLGGQLGTFPLALA